MEELSNQITELERDNEQLRLDLQVQAQKIASYDELEVEMGRMAHKIGQLEEEKSVSRHAIDVTTQELSQKNEEIRKLRNEIERVTRENEMLSRSQS